MLLRTLGVFNLRCRRDIRSSRCGIYYGHTVDQLLNLWQRSKRQILRQQYPAGIRIGGERITHSSRSHTPYAGFISTWRCCGYAPDELTQILAGRKKIACCVERAGVHFWIRHYPIKGWAQTHTFCLHSMQLTKFTHSIESIHLRDSIKYFILS